MSRQRIKTTLAEGAFLATALIPALALDNEELVVKAAGVLGRLGPGAKAAIPALATLAKSTDYPLRKAALDALRKLDPRPTAEKGP